MTIGDGKAGLRTIFRQKRDAYVAAMSPADRRIAFSAVPAPLLSQLQPGKTVAGYIAIGSEADPARLLSHAADRGCRLALPYVTTRTSPMRFLAWAPGDLLEPGPFGLRQPVADSAVVVPDLVIVPLLAFDAAMMRLGQGGGHYDRALSQLPNATAVGLGWSVQQAPAIAADPWDVPLHAVLTEKCWMTS